METSRSLLFRLFLPLVLITALTGCARKKEAAPQPVAWAARFRTSRRVGRVGRVFATCE